jgi:hypothetical protein
MKFLNSDADNISEALNYMKNRSFQLLKYNIVPTDVKVSNFGVVVEYEGIKDKKQYYAVYVLKSYRNRGILKEIASNRAYQFINLYDTNLLNSLERIGIKHFTVGIFHRCDEYKSVIEYLSDSKEEDIYSRNKLEMSLAILEWASSDDLIKKASCIIPSIYTDSGLVVNQNKIKNFNPQSVFYATEFRHLMRKYEYDNFRGKTNSDVFQYSKLENALDDLKNTVFMSDEIKGLILTNILKYEYIYNKMYKSNMSMNNPVDHYFKIWRKYFDLTEDFMKSYVTHFDSVFDLFELDNFKKNEKKLLVL